MNQKGLALVAIILLISIVAVVFLTLKTQFKPTNLDKPSLNTTESPIPQPTLAPSSSPSQLKTPKVTPTAKPNTTQTTNTPTASSSKSSCDINIEGTSDSNPLTVNLGYSAKYEAGKSVTGAQWDFDGDGNWDSDMSLSNGRLSHTFPSGANYNVKLHLKMSDGETTDVCQKTVPVSPVITVTLSGTVYLDNNCNGTKDSDETGYSGMKISIMNPNGGPVYQEVTSGSSGNYSFSKTIKQDDSLTVQPNPYDHNKVFEPATVTLNRTNQNSTVDISHCEN